MTPEQKQLADKLTNLQLQTVLGVVAGKSQRQAYYDAGGKAKNDAAADTSAYEILSRPEVKAFYDAMIAETAKDAKITLEAHLARLKELADAAASEGKYSAAVAAEIARGKASGLYIEKVANTDSQGSDIPAIPMRIALVAPDLGQDDDSEA